LDIVQTFFDLYFFIFVERLETSIYMAFKSPKFSFSFYCILLFLVVTSCFQNKKNEEQIVPEIKTGDQAELQNYIENGLSQLKSWVSHWKNTTPNFTVKGFKASRTLTFEPLEYPEEVPYNSNSVFYDKLIKHPKGKGVADIYGYKIILPENNNPYFNADSEVAFYKNDGMRERLLFMGPSGAFEDAVWVSDDYLLVAGFFEEENGITPKLWLINTEKKIYIEFIHEIVTRDYPKESYLKEKFKVVEF